MGFSALRPSESDSAPHTVRSVVIDPVFNWEGDRPPKTAYPDSVLYEVHVRGLTRRHPDVPPELRGTFAGLAHDAIVGHLRRLGVTAVELMPVHQSLPEYPLVSKGLTNYWGYSTIGYFAPHNGYAAAAGRDGQVAEFKTMVRTLHAAGIEVILDVVFNHTFEGNHLGPTLCFRGIDNAAYYRLKENDPRYNVDFSGCGNCLNTRHPNVLMMVMDSLRYWVTEMHVDGFRFDLASVLARELGAMDRLSAFFDLVQQDPVVSQVKLIAEPWDVGEGGYQIGNFPPLWTEWNGKYRDGIRDFWRGRHTTLREFAIRLTGSSDLYQHYSRRPLASVNLVTCHDGFTLHDLVSYEHKHNEANGENNEDGFWDNRSWNCGVEGPTDDPAILALRARQKRNFLATLLLSHGVPMLLGGDEMNRTQRGNNNPYNQDNEVSWFDWSKPDDELAGFVATLTDLRRAHPVFRRRRFLRALPGADQATLVRDDDDGARRRVVRRVGRADDRRRLEDLRPGDGGVPERCGDHRARPGWAAHRGRLVPAAGQHGARRDLVRPARAAVPRAVGGRAGHRSDGGRRRHGAKRTGATGGVLAVSPAPAGGRSGKRVLDFGQLLGAELAVNRLPGLLRQAVRVDREPPRGTGPDLPYRHVILVEGEPGHT